uniref:Uncharacterized protein n=1 Tax=Strongyloides stercoralis TaxID=6248 RepID=A0A0K0EIY6_STRER
MIYYFLIYYIFSITFLLKAANEYGSQNNLIEESPKFTKGHRRNREIFYIEMEDHAKEKHKKIKWGDDKVVTFDKQDPPVFISGRTTKPPR